MIEKAYLAAKAAGIVALVAANIYGPAAIADEAAGAQRVAWIAPSREPATARKNVIFVKKGKEKAREKCERNGRRRKGRRELRFIRAQKDLGKNKASLKEKLEREKTEKEKTEKTAAKREIFNGCTADQVSSMKSSTCISKADDDLINKRPLVHIVVCKGTEIVCCLQDDHERYSQCEAMGGMAPPKPDVVCSTLSSAKGVWQADPRSIKAGSDKHNCTQVYTCTPPLPRELSAS